MSSKKSGDARRKRAIKALTKEQTDAITGIQRGYEERIARQVGIINRFKEEGEMLKTEARASGIAIAALLEMHGLPKDVEGGIEFHEQISGDLLKEINYNTLTVDVADDGSNDISITYTKEHKA